MNAETKILETLQKLERNSRPMQTWVKPSWITYLTGWNGEKMRQARQSGLIKFRSNGSGSYEYLVQSIPDQFLINKTKAA
jgi:hypothetical protein